MELVIGNKAWSSWSMRPWLVLKKAGAEFSEIHVELRQGARTEAAVAPPSPSANIRALKDGEITIWDSRGICESVAEKSPKARLWPQDRAQRALARAAAAEMHSGFSSLRGEC